jgi:hypothetical protein
MKPTRARAREKPYRKYPPDPPDWTIKPLIALTLIIVLVAVAIERLT